MKKVLKLLILILISLSVYFIYQSTNHKTIKILSIGDALSLGINSYGIKEYGYLDYYKDYLVKKGKEVTIINKFSKRNLTIDELIEKIKATPELKRDLSQAHELYLNVGYNDLIYKLSLEENLNQNSFNRIMKEIQEEYDSLLIEIRKYYKNDITIIGYYKSNQEDYYLNIGIRQINTILKQHPEITYIDTYKLLENRKKYFGNPKSYYPNRYGYQAISKKIIEKTLEKSENI